MPSFDVVSEVDLQEVNNAVDQANRELATRFDFRGVDASFERNDDVVSLAAEADIQLEQMLDILKAKLVKRSVDTGVLEVGEHTPSGKRLLQSVKIRQGIDGDLSKNIVKMIKAKKMKVQAAIQGDQVRITGKKRDDLQEAIALVRGSELEQAFQFTNFRD